MPVSAFAAESIALESDVDLPSDDPGQLADAFQGSGALGECHDLNRKSFFSLSHHCSTFVRAS